MQKDKKFIFRLASEDTIRLKELANYLGRSQSEVMRWLLRQAASDVANAQQQEGTK